MSKEKQIIEEMAKIISEKQNGGWKFVGDSEYTTDVSNEELAEHIYNAGYRKPSEGEWIDANPNGAVYKFACTLCGETKLGKGTPYCPNCGAKMKGGE